MTGETLCPCGQPLHYSDPAIQAYVDLLIAELGPTIPVSTSAGTFHVPRHFIALHGLDASALPRLARLYRWGKEQVATHG
jgi:hypothetical protein